LRKSTRIKSTTAIANCLASIWLVVSSAHAEDTPEEAPPILELLVQPFAELRLVSAPLMFMSVPPAGTALPGARVRFEVRGNAHASVSAAPEDWVSIPSLGDLYLGKAILQGQDDETENQIGYDITLRFPSAGPGPLQSRSLPGGNGQGTEPLTVTLNGATRQGAIDLVADHHWTASDGLPKVGLYVGQVVITVSAN
jgi:hypothetical protein